MTSYGSKLAIGIGANSMGARRHVLPLSRMVWRGRQREQYVSGSYWTVFLHGIAHSTVSATEILNTSARYLSFNVQRPDTILWRQSDSDAVVS